MDNKVTNLSYWKSGGSITVSTTLCWSKITKNEYIIKVTSQPEFDDSNNDRIFNIRAIKDTRVYAKKFVTDYPLHLYYLIYLKNNPEAKNV